MLNGRVDKLPQIVTRVSTVPVLDWTVTRVETRYPCTRAGFYRPNNDLAVGIEVRCIGRSGPPGRLVVQDRRVETWVPVLVRRCSMRRVVPIKLGPIDHLVVVDEFLDGRIATPVVVSIRAVSESRQGVVLPSPALEEVAAEDGFLAVLLQEQVSIILEGVPRFILDFIDAKINHVLGSSLSGLPLGYPVARNGNELRVAIPSCP